MATRVHLGRQAESHQFRPSAELPLTGRQITTHPVRNVRAENDFATPMAFQFGKLDPCNKPPSPPLVWGLWFITLVLFMNNGLYMLRSAVVKMPISAKFTTFSQNDMTREQVASIALRNRPVKAFRTLKTEVVHIGLS